jgi:hypothetical protein
MKSKKYTKVCPKCGSVNVTIPPAGLDIKMTAPDYCKDCEFIGLFPEVEESGIKEFRTQLKKNG